MTRRLWISLIATLVVVYGALIMNLVRGNQPILGLDLQGGVSMILAPVQEGADSSELEITRDLVRDELERSGVAEPDVRVQGTNIVVDLPGIDNPDEVLDRVRVSGVVELRPVVAFEQCTVVEPDFSVTEVGEAETNPDAAPASGGADDAPTDDAAADEAPADSGDDAESTSDAGDVQGFVRNGVAERFASYELVRSAPDDTTPTDDAADGDDEVGPQAPADVEIPADEPIDFSTVQTPTPGFDLLPTLDGGALCLGPTQGSGEVFERQGASVQNDPGSGGIFVVARLRDEGEVIWNSLAAQCFNGAPTCPAQGGSSRGQLAIVLDSVVQSAPTVNAPSFDEEVQITGSFSVDEAEDLANVLNRGAFPVQLEPQDTRTVSPSTGSGSLRAAVVAGLIGFALVLTLLISYYRLFGLVIIAGMVTWAAAVYSVAAFVSDWTNYTLSLAGVTGIIVAIGVTVDSYIVFFERMKDEIRNGRTPRNAAPRSFNSTWRTIWTADLVSVIGAAILFALSVGSVRGFALYLGITTLCDLAICYFFTRPSVVLLARSRFMKGRSAFGLEVAR